YQIRSAISATSARPRCRSTRSRSPPGVSSRRAWLPTAASATPSAGGRTVPSPDGPAVRREPSRRSRSAARAARAAARAARAGSVPSGPVPAGRGPGRGSPGRGAARVTGRLEGFRPGLAGADADDGVDGHGPDLAVADLVGAGGLDDHVDDVVGVLGVDEDLDPQLGHQVDLVLGAAVDLGVALLAAVAAGLADGHALDPEGLQGLLDLVQLERLDDGRDELHPLRLHLLARAFGLRRVARGRGGDRRPGRARAARPDGAEVVGRLGVDDAVEAGGLVVLAD